MGIDIYAVWNGQTAEEKKRQFEVWLSSDDGNIGYLREAYHGEPYATRFLFRESFVSESDRQENELSLKHGYRLFSVYHDKNGTKFWIITEADRSATTVLLPDDY